MRYGSSGMRASGGFTLIEVLIALTVAGIALASVIKITGQYAGNLAAVQERVYGHWVAMNQVTRMQLEQKWPEAELKKGEARIANVPVFWRTAVFDTSYERVRRIEVQVFRHEDDDEFVARLNSYTGRESNW